MLHPGLEFLVGLEPPGHPGRLPPLVHQQDLVVLERLVNPLLQEDLVLRGCLVNLQIIFIEKLG